MGVTVGKFWNKFKTQPDVWFFCGFLLTFTLTIRKVLFYFPIERTFNEYTGIYVYMSDIFLILALFFWSVSLLYNNNHFLSRYKLVKLWITKFVHTLSLSLPLLFVLFSFISILWSENQLIALFRSIKLIELYLLYLYLIFRFIPLFYEYKLDNCQNVVASGGELFHVEQSNDMYCNQIVPRGTILEDDADVKQLQVTNCSTWNNFSRIIIFVGAFQSIVAIWQFIIQRSLGLRFLWESVIDPSLPGVAKVIFNDQVYIRAYGLFPHPNILGGFLVFSIIITWLYYKLFHVEQLAEKGMRSQIVPRGTIFTQQNKKWLIKGIILLQVIALLLTFSKSAILALIFAVMYILWKSKSEQWVLDQNCSTWNNFDLVSNTPSTQTECADVIVPRGTIYKNEEGLECFKKDTCDANVPRGTFTGLRSWVKGVLCGFSKMFHVEQSRIMVLSVLILLIVFGLFFKLNMHFFISQSLNERLFYQNVSRGTILESPVLGVGAGQFVLNIPIFVKKVVPAWQYQPVHNVYLLIWSELGLIGLVLFLWWIYKLFHVEQLAREDMGKQIVPRGTMARDVTNRNREKVESSISILNNNRYNLSIENILIYFKGIFLAFLFIMLFDHYLWDIWQGQVLFWLTAGLLAGVRKVY